MIGLVIIVCFTALLGVVLWWFDRRNHPRGEKKDEVTVPQEQNQNEQEQECCGLHIVCEKDTLSPFTTEIEYYDDEELDRFAGREAGDYTEEEIEEWRDILLTMRPEEIAGWARSIQLREIEMPSPIRDELLLIVAESRVKQV